MPRLFLAGALALAFVTHAQAFDNGQYESVSPEIREWYRSMQRPAGGSCCDIADGHSTTWRGSKDGGYEVQIDGKWLPVPQDSVILNKENPTGEAIVWYVKRGDMYYIMCFIPNGAI